MRLFIFGLFFTLTASISSQAAVDLPPEVTVAIEVQCQQALHESEEFALGNTLTYGKVRELSPAERIHSSCAGRVGASFCVKKETKNFLKTCIVQKTTEMMAKAKLEAQVAKELESQ